MTNINYQGRESLWIK